MHKQMYQIEVYLDLYITFTFLFVIQHDGNNWANQRGWTLCMVTNKITQFPNPRSEFFCVTMQSVQPLWANIYYTVTSVQRGFLQFN